MTIKQTKALMKIKKTATQYNVGAIEADAAMIQVMGTLAVLDNSVEQTKEPHVEVSNIMQARMAAARNSQPLDQIANDREMW